MEEEGYLIVEVSFIPKNMGASDAKDYRPINLIGSVYKIVPKVLAKILKLVWGLMSQTQNVLHKGDRSPDSSLIANVWIVV